MNSVNTDVKLVTHCMQIRKKLQAV